MIAKNSIKYKYVHLVNLNAVQKALLSELPLASPYSWNGSCVGTETTLHQIAPYIGKMKSTMARSLIEFSSKPGDTVLDPFVGSGVIALESLMAGRNTISSDINPYAIVLTRAKLFAPSSLNAALSLAKHYLKCAKEEYAEVNIDDAPDWVRGFFHPETLREALALTRVLRKDKQYFLLGCLLGILHHQRPGFLSYPASHAVPYLRTLKFPRDRFPELYKYRDVRSRLFKKIGRAYRRFPNIDKSSLRKCYLKDAESLRLPEESVDAVVTSPPYMNALDYVRDNRLRLWFLGYDNLNGLGQHSPKNVHEFHELMRRSLRMIQGVLRPKRRCVMVVGEVRKSDFTIDTADVLLNVAEKIGGYDCEAIIEDCVPQDRRVRRKGSCTRREWIVVLRKGY